MRDTFNPFPTHDTVPVEVEPGVEVLVDVGVADVVRALLAAGIRTISSCQGDVERPGSGYVAFDGHDPLQVGTALGIVAKLRPAPDEYIPQKYAVEFFPSPGNSHIPVSTFVRFPVPGHRFELRHDLVGGGELADVAQQLRAAATGVGLDPDTVEELWREGMDRHGFAQAQPEPEVYPAKHPGAAFLALAASLEPDPDLARDTAPLGPGGEVVSYPVKVLGPPLVPQLLTPEVIAAREAEVAEQVAAILARARAAELGSEPDPEPDAVSEAELLSVAGLSRWVLSARFTTVAWPVQIEGQLLDDAGWFYFRGRDRRVGIGIGPTLDAAHLDWFENGSRQQLQIADAGVLGRREALTLLAQLLAERLDS